MSNKHPPYNCENCGITHPSYGDQKELKHENKKTRNILILIICISMISIPLGLTVFDLEKNPYSLESSIDMDLFDKGYDIVCNSDLGMQVCIMKGNDSNHLAYNTETLVIQSKANPCLNIYLQTPDKTTDRFMIKNGTDCVSSLEFPINNDWSYNQFGIVGKDNPNPNDYGVFFTAKKIKYWWNDWWLDL